MTMDQTLGEKSEISASDVRHIEAASCCDEDTHSREKRLIRKIDLMVMPWLCILYGFSFIDRSNISAAKVAGMATDLELTGYRYSIALLVFFPTYIAIEIPSNYLIKRVGTKYWLAFLIGAWGTVALCCGLVQTFGQLVVLRVLLGLTEGGFAPACFYLISSWYKRYETHKRIAVWYTFGTVMSAFNGIISYGLSSLNGKSGLRGWRWVFIVPGAITAALSIPVLLFIADFPERAQWLKEEDLLLVQRRLQEDRGEDIHDKITFQKALSSLLDPKVWLMSLMLCFVTTGTYVMAFFTPSILNGLGYSVALSQILITPPYILAVVVSIFIAIWADRIHRRTPFIVAFYALTMIGFAMIGWGKNNACKYAGVFIAITGVNSVTPCVLTFLVNNVPNPSKRAIAVPLQTCFNGIGGIIGSLIFRQEDSPGYRPGLYGAFAANSLGIIITVFFIFYFHRQNKRADREGIVLENIPGFHYTL